MFHDQCNAIDLSTGQLSGPGLAETAMDEAEGEHEAAELLSESGF